MSVKILYHKNCADGFCAAWVFHKYYPYADFIPVQHYQEPLLYNPDDEVIIVDFSYKRDILEGIKRVVKSLTVLDHHKTAKEELAGLDYCTFDMDKSGGRLAWDYCFPGQKPHWLVDFTEDRDLWRWKLAFSKEINAAIASHPFDFEVWDGFDPAELMKEGKAILRYQNQLVDNAVKNAYEVELLGHKVLGVNATNLISEIGGKLAEGRPFGLTLFETEDKTIFSLRSRDAGVDVGQIAASLGGGGHRNAAGFTIEHARKADNVKEALRLITALKGH
jgi:oligoribonuclease NrnB/cAMP/cGMP phosphodiesterase (DHH superfamily)